MKMIIVSNRILLIFVSITFFVLLIPLSILAQQPGMDFDLPPPPPPPAAGDDFGLPPFNPNNDSMNSDFGRGKDKGSDKDKDKNKDSIISKPQKDKLSKAGIEDITDENFPEIIESFDFPNADIQDVVKAISELTGKNFILDQNVRGKITIIAPSKITVAEAYKAFLSSLAINNLTIVKSGGFLKIRNARTAQKEGIETYSGSYYPNSDQMITRIVHLKHVQAEQLQKDLRPLISKDGDLTQYAQTNSLMVSDWGSNVDRLMKILSQLDVPGFDDQLEVIPVKYAKAKELADLVDKIVNKGANRNQGGSGFSAGLPRFTRTSGPGNQGSAYYMVIPDDRTNSLIIVGNKAGIDKIKKLIAQLDFPLRTEDSGGIHVYYVRFGEAEKIAATLTGIAKEATAKPGTGGTPGGPGASIQTGPLGTNLQVGGAVPGQQAPGSASGGAIFGGDVKITADKNTNSLVIVASKQDYQVVKSILKKLDIPRDQVFIEAIIMEMNISDTFNWETGVVQYNDSGYGKGGWQGLRGDSLSGILNPVGGEGAILGFASKDTVKVKNPFQNNQEMVLPNLMAFITFLQKNANANILSTPTIMAMDNQEAEIKFGDKVAVGMNTTTPATGGASQTSAQFEEANTELNIKPFISPTSNTVRMEIKSSVKQPSSAITPKALQDTTQPLATRAIKTNIVIPNGDTAIIGGLMKENFKENVSKVPLLGDIPIIGWLFKSRNSEKVKTNMLVFITPKIVRNPEDNKQVLENKLDERLGFIKSMGGLDPFGKKVDEIMKVQKAEAPTPPAPIDIEDEVEQ